MIRTKGEAGTGDVVEAVRHARSVHGAIRKLQLMPYEELMTFAKQLGAPYHLVKETKDLNFAAGGIATPADAAMMMQLGVDGVFVGSGIFKSGDPASRGRAIVESVAHYNEPKILAKISENLGEPMVGISVSTLSEEERLAVRGW
jgi:pyridoxal 5'-phosphate synthase pdxS subunit